MSGLKSKKEKKETPLGEWFESGPMKLPEIRPDAGQSYARYMEENVAVFDFVAMKPIVQTRIVVEQKVVWPDGKVQFLSRTLK